MTKILAKKFYHEAGEQVDRKLEHIQSVIFRLACVRANPAKKASCKLGKLSKRSASKKK